jgi:hypothetical protein
MTRYDSPKIDAASLEHVSEVSVSTGRKRQLEQYEPINEQVTLTLEFSDEIPAEEKKAAIEVAEEAAWDQCEGGVMRRYEEHIREEAFGD